MFKLSSLEVRINWMSINETNTVYTYIYQEILSLCFNQPTLDASIRDILDRLMTIIQEDWNDLRSMGIKIGNELKHC